MSRRTLQDSAFGWLLRPTSALFEPTPAPSAPSSRERWIVFSLVLLAAFVRFWGVGSFSLHKPDEDTTVLAATHILLDGTPQFPSGMYYARAIVQSYLIAGAELLFGSSEFAYRLPSVLCGVLLVWLVWMASRRFLEPVWRIVLTATMVLLPAAVADAQEARMYSFFVASLTGYLVVVFRWERTGRIVDLIAAVAVMLIALQFQELALFGALAVLLPGILRADSARFAQGLIAVLIMCAGYVVISTWQGSYYPPVAQGYLPDYTDPLRTPPALPVPRVQFPLVLASLGAAVLIGLISRRSLRSNANVIVLAAGIGFALLLQASYAYHLAGLVWLVIVVVALRARVVPHWFWALCVVAVAALAFYQLQQLHGAGLGLRKALGQLAGRPSIWAYLQLALTSKGAAFVSGLGLVAALVGLAQKHRISEIWLFFVLTVWLPLLAIGFFAWFLPPRYVQFAMIPLLITAFVAASQVRWRGPAGLAAAIVVAFLVVGPAGFTHALDAGRGFPNHKAAASFLNSRLGPDDVVIAEEALIHAFYLGRVDYWLASPQVAAPFVVRKDGRLLDQYTHAELIDSLAGLQAVAQAAKGGRVYLVGSAEGGDRLYFRGAEVNGLLESGRLTEIYRGADGTRVWDLTNGIPAL